MSAVRNVLIVDFDFSSQKFLVKDLCTQKEVQLPVSEFFGTSFKYDLGFISRFTSAINQYDDKPDIVITEDANQKIDSLIEFNRIDT